ncbi:hypothetical protein [Bifidobacterium sp. SO4]|uniref:hypothetical protein n=1 Tax=Bifidobacterium sp. SO4 TaxID=2809030 RepID=UPI001BDD852A|nr:hypothetical protein [Bifidobacterium sp. SO4]MBT1171286.1 hypothetical protein [Bifidobacterium sp. SO4]
MNRNKVLAIASMLFAVISAMFAMTDAPYGAAGFAIAAGLAGLFAGWRRGDDD